MEDWIGDAESTSGCLFCGGRLCCRNETWEEVGTVEMVGFPMLLDMWTAGAGKSKLSSA